MPEGTRVALDSGYSSSVNIKFLEDKKLDGYVPSRAQAQKFEGKEETLNHDDYEYYRKNTDRKILIYKSDDGTKKDVPEFFKESYS